MNFDERIIDENYLNIVRSSNVLLKAGTSASFISEVTSICHYQSDPEIGLILGSAKKADNSYLIVGFSEADRYAQIRALMDSSVFTSGITRVSALLTASVLVGNIPLEGDLKQYSLSVELRKRAIENLDRIIAQVEQEAARSSVPAEDSNLSGKFFFGLDIDVNSLPAFSPSVPIATNPRLYEQLPIPEDQIAVGWYYLSCLRTAGIERIEHAFRVENWTLEEVLENTALAINQKSLEESNLANILAGITGTTAYKAVTFERTQDYYYPGQSKVNAVQGSVNAYMGYLTLATRHRDEADVNELISLKFYTIYKTEAVPTEFKTADTAYLGDWDEDLAYLKGQVVHYGNQDYVCLVSHSAEPVFNPIQWRLLLYTEDILKTGNRNPALPYVPGLLFGTSDSYNFLTRRGPRSIIVSVKQGQSTKQSIESSEAVNGTVDTFYFRALRPVDITVPLKFRISSDFAGILEYEVTLSTDRPADEEASFAILEELYSTQNRSKVLGALVYPYAVQMVAFQESRFVPNRDRDVHYVIDITQLPPGLDVNVGTSFDVKVGSDWSSGLRSVVIKPTLQAPNSRQSDAQGTADRSISVANPKQSHQGRSPLMRSVYDKINRLEEIEYTNPVRRHL
jgi:hypothetical protein